MARVLRSYEFRTESRNGRTGIYRWSEWLNGKIWQLEQGVDYENKYSMRSAAYQKARRRGVKVRINIFPDHAVLQAYPQ